MNHVEFLNRYSNLLFLPLDWSMPGLDQTTFSTWCDHNREFSTSIIREITKNPQSEATDGFWWIHYLFHKGRWAPGFTEQYPEWVEFFESSPLRNRSTFYVLQQTDECLKTGYLHFDEKRIPGLRAYVNGDEGLYFRRLKDPTSLPSVKDLNFLLSMRHNEALLNGPPIHIDLPQSNVAFLLGNQCAPHAVCPSVHGPRKLTFVMQSGNAPEDAYDWDALETLVQQSLRKYAEFALRC